MRLHVIIGGDQEPPRIPYVSCAYSRKHYSPFLGASRLSTHTVVVCQPSRPPIRPLRHSANLMTLPCCRPRVRLGSHKSFAAPIPCSSGDNFQFVIVRPWPTLGMLTGDTCCIKLTLRGSSGSSLRVLSGHSSCGVCNFLNDAGNQKLNVVKVGKQQHCARRGQSTIIADKCGTTTLLFDVSARFSCGNDRGNPRLIPLIACGCTPDSTSIKCGMRSSKTVDRVVCDISEVNWGLYHPLLSAIASQV